MFVIETICHRCPIAYDNITYCRNDEVIRDEHLRGCFNGFLAIDVDLDNSTFNEYYHRDCKHEFSCGSSRLIITHNYITFYNKNEGFRVNFNMSSVTVEYL